MTIDLKAKIYCILENNQMFVSIKPRQKWTITKIGSEYFMMRDCISIRAKESTINHIFDTNYGWNELADEIIKDSGKE